MPIDLNRLLELSPWVPAAIILALALIIGVVARFLLLFGIRYYQRRDKSLFKALENHLKSSWFLFIPLIFIHIGVGYLDISDSLIAALRKWTDVLIIMSLASILLRLASVVQDLLFIRYDISQADNLKARKARTQIIYVKKVAIVMIVLLAAALILVNFASVRKFGTTILTGAGVAGIIIGFALQKSLANLFAGIQIAFTQPIKIDDAVVVENEWGWIEEINLTYVVVRIWDLRRLVLPITYFTDNAFQNWTRNSAQILGSVFLYVDYTLPIEPLRRHFEEILETTELWDRQTQVLQVTDCNDKIMTIRLLMTAKNSPTAWDLRCYVREQMIDFIQQNYPESLPKVRALLDPQNTVISPSKSNEPPV